MTDEKFQAKLEQVRALLAKAASTTYPEEADACRQKADELMTIYTIQQWMVDEAEAGRHARPAPEKRMYDYSWYMTNPFRSQLWWMLQAVGKHCRCRVITQKTSYPLIPVFGLPTDLDWFDVLFTSLMNQMTQKIDPQPRTDLTLMENLAMMREAGMPWQTAIERIIRLGETEDITVEEGATFDSVYKPWVHEYRRWCRATGHPQSYVNQRTYREHFADGFSMEIEARLRHMRRLTEEHVTESTGSGMEVALRDIEQVIIEAVWEEYPELKPHPPDCDCPACHIRKCRDPKCKRPGCVEKRKPVRARSYKAPKIDFAAQQAGREAAREAEITNNPNRRVSPRRELPS